jgi:membrane protein implicated in regulation of membrane protease activity
MSTTTIIVEVLIIGFFAAVWLLLACLRFSLIEISSLRAFLSQATPWSTALFFIAAVVLYQLGLLMNLVSHKLTKPFGQKSLRDQIVAGKDYETVRATVFQKGSSEILRDIVLYLSFVRIARSGILNFLLTGLVLVSFGGRAVPFGLIALLVSFSCIPLWRSMFRTYYRRMGFAYCVVSETSSTAEGASRKSQAEIGATQLNVRPQSSESVSKLD